MERLVCCRRSLSVAEELRAKVIVFAELSILASHTSYNDQNKDIRNCNSSSPSFTIHLLLHLQSIFFISGVKMKYIWYIYNVVYKNYRYVHSTTRPGSQKRSCGWQTLEPTPGHLLVWRGQMDWSTSILQPVKRSQYFYIKRKLALSQSPWFPTW